MKKKRKKTALVLFNGAGLAMHGLEQAGLECTGVEIDYTLCAMAAELVEGRILHIDVRDLTYRQMEVYDLIWASPPCQWHSSARTQGPPVSPHADADLLQWSLDLRLNTDEPFVIVENVMNQKTERNRWGTPYNAAQFELEPRQCRNRIIWKYAPSPKTFRPYRRSYPSLNLCPAITATEYKGCATDKRRASRYYGRRLTIEECAYRMGLDVVPQNWYAMTTKQKIYEAIGNGVTIPMARAFGEAVMAV